jgi:large subunit ribosomal protein L31e
MAGTGDEQVYTIPLRAVKYAPRWQRSKKAVNEVFKFLERHTKTDRTMIRMDPTISEKLWERGSGKPPSKIRVRTTKFEDGIIETELATE